MHVLVCCEPESLAQLDCTCSFFHAGGLNSKTRRSILRVTKSCFGDSLLGRYAAEILRGNLSLRLSTAFATAKHTAHVWMAQGAVEPRNYVRGTPEWDNLSRPLTLAPDKPLHQILVHAFASECLPVGIMLGDRVGRLHPSCRMAFTVAALLEVIDKSVLPPQGYADLVHILVALCQANITSLNTWALADMQKQLVTGLVNLCDHGEAAASALPALKLEADDGENRSVNPLWDLASLVDRRFFFARMVGAMELLLMHRCTVHRSSIDDDSTLTSACRKARKALYIALQHLHDFEPRPGEAYDLSAYSSVVFRLLESWPMWLDEGWLQVQILQLITEAQLQLIIPDAQLPRLMTLVAAMMRAHDDLDIIGEEVTEELAAEQHEYAVVFQGIQVLCSWSYQALWGYRQGEEHSGRRERITAVEQVLPVLIDVVVDNIGKLGYDLELSSPPSGVLVAVKALFLMAASPVVASRPGVAAAIVSTLDRYPPLSAPRSPFNRDRSDLLSEGIEALALLAQHDSVAVVNAGALRVADRALESPRHVERVWDAAMWLLAIIAWDPTACDLMRRAACEPDSGLAAVAQACRCLRPLNGSSPS